MKKREPQMEKRFLNLPHFDTLSIGELCKEHKEFPLGQKSILKGLKKRIILSFAYGGGILQKGKKDKEKQ